jgi:hypothetical protein
MSSTKWRKNSARPTIAGSPRPARDLAQAAERGNGTPPAR